MSNRIEALATLERAVQSFFSLQRFAAVLNGMRSALGRAARMISQPSDVRFVVATVIAYGAAIAIGTELTREAGNAAAIWPANGILCAALLSTSRRGTRDAMLVLGATVNCAIMYLMGDVLAACMAFAIINASEALLTYLLIQRFCPDALNFTYGRSLLRFCLIAGFFGPILPSIAGAAVINTAYGADFLTVLKTWYFADALGLLIVIPALLLLVDKDEWARQMRSKTEIAGLFLTLSATDTLVFYQNSYPLLFLIPAIIVRIAFRLGPSYTAAAVLATGFVAFVCTFAGFGPATLGAGSQLSERILIVQIFILVAFYSALPAANAFAEQQRLQHGLDIQIQSSDELAKELRESKEQLDIAVNNMSQGLCMYDAQGRVVIRNDAFALVYGLKPDQVLPGMTLRQVVELRIANGIFAGENPQQYLAERLTPVTSHSCSIHHLNNGRSVAITQRPLSCGGWVTTQEDITESRSIEKRLAFLAHHDALTGLANRALLHDRIELTLTRVRRGEEAAVLFLDLDHFKSVNDTFGHATGDELLKIVAGRLRVGLRETDTIARLGGDEFAILLVGAKQPEGAGVVARRIVDLMSAPVMIDGKQIRIGTSIGIATAPHDAETTSDLLKCADLALYKAKAEGRGTHRFFEAEMDTRMHARQKLEQDLRTAVSENGFTLHYQPLVNLETNEVSGFEALIRWNHEERGMVSPADFIPLAEETGLIIPIGQWVLKQACRDAAAWAKPLTVAVNLSRVQLMSPGIVETVIAVLAETGLSPGRLQLEITETAVMKDADMALQVLEGMRSIGVEIAMDDFGTGHSSLGCLRRFPFNKIKIDRSFINDLTTSLEARSILRTIIALAKVLGMSITAEGIETAEQLDIVRAEGCSEMQGYFFSKPKPITELSRFTRPIDYEECQAA